MITNAIRQLVDDNDLTAEEAHAAMMQVMSGDASPAQIAAFVVGLRMKGETPEEVAGCARAMRAASSALGTRTVSWAPCRRRTMLNASTESCSSGRGAMPM